MKTKHVAPLLISLLLAAAILLAPPQAMAAYSGYCGGEGDGKNLQWSLDTFTDELVITGSGPMADYSNNSAPWGRYSSSIHSVSLPPDLTTISNGAFSSCHSLRGNLTIPGKVTTIGAYAFEDTNFSSITVSEQNPYFSSLDGILYNKSKTTLIKCPTRKTGSITIPDGVITIGDSAFDRCTGLRGALYIPDSVATIGKWAFYECRGFSGALTIPDSVTSIGDRAFGYCSGLSGSLFIPHSVTTIGADAFVAIEFTEITVSADNPSYSSLDGVLYDKDKTTLIRCPSGKIGSLTIAEGVTTIGYGAFVFCWGITGSLTIPDSVITIGDQAFDYCRGFTGNLTIPDSVTTIGDRAFEECTGFTGNLTIGSGVTSIGFSAFKECGGFTGAYFRGDAPTVSSSTSYSSLPATLILYYIPGKSGWTSPMWRGYQTAAWNWKASESSGVWLNDVEINGYGYGYLRFSICDTEGRFLPNEKISYNLNGRRYYAETDNYGIACVKTPLLSNSGNSVKTENLTFEFFSDHHALSNATQIVPVKIKPLSFSQTWAGKSSADLEASLGLGVGGSIGVASAEAEAAGLGLAKSVTAKSEIVNEYRNGQRHLTFKSSFENGLASKAQAGLFAQASALGAELDVSALELGAGAGAAKDLTIGLKLEDYNPGDPHNILKISGFLFDNAVIMSSGNVFTAELMRLLPITRFHNIDGAGISVGLDANARVGAVDVGNIGFTLAGLGAKTVYSYDVTQDSDTRSLSSGIKADAGGGIGYVGGKINPSGDTVNSIGAKLSVYEQDFANNDTSLKVDYLNGALDSFSITGVVGERKSFLVVEDTENITTELTLNKREAAKILPGDPRLDSFARGNKPFFSAGQMLGSVNYLMHHIDSGQLTSSKEVSRQIGGVKFPIGLEAGLGLNLGLQFAFIESRDYDISQSAIIDGRTYPLMEAVIDDQVAAQTTSIEAILSEPIAALGIAIGETVLSAFSAVEEAFVELGDAVVSGIEDCRVRISGLISGERDVPRSYMIMSLPSDAEPLAKAAIAATVGAPYIVQVFTDTSEPTELTDFSAHPLDLSLGYSEAMLNAAGASLTDASLLRIFRWDEDRSVYILRGGEVDTVKQTVNLAITRPGQYILAIDTLPPIVSDFALSNYTAQPTLSALISDLSGIAEFSFKLDDEELVTQTNLNDYYDSKSGQFTYPLSRPLREGEHTVSFRAADSAGNSLGAPFEDTFTIDSAPPVIDSIDCPDEVKGLAGFTVQARVTEANLASVKAVLSFAGQDGVQRNVTQEMVNEGGTGIEHQTSWTTTVSGYNDVRQIAVHLVAVDQAGNSVSSPPHTVVLNLPPSDDDVSVEINAPLDHAQGTSVAVKISGYESKDLLAHTVCAAYDDNGRMIDLDIRELTIEAGSNSTKNIIFDQPRQQIAEVKVFILDSLDQPTPLCVSAQWSATD